MREWTETQLETVLVWLDLQWNVPSRADHYAMQTSCEVRRVLSKKPNEIKLGSFQIPFIQSKPVEPYVRYEGGPPGPLTKEEVVKYRASMRLAQVKVAGVKRGK